MKYYRVIYEAYHDRIRDHHYSENYLDAHPGIGYYLTGKQFILAAEQYAGLVPFYKLWNQPAGDHLFSINPELRKNNGYICERILGYISLNKTEDMPTPLYRFWSEPFHDHYLSTSMTPIDKSYRLDVPGDSKKPLGYVAEQAIDFYLKNAEGIIR